MKKALLLVSSFILSAALFAQQKKVEDVVKFKEMSYDFGKIKQNVPVTHDFAFQNISDAPVIIESATPSCGCTTPVKPEGAVPKGKDDKIKAGFNAASPGRFNKTITIKVAGIDEPVQLKITGEVLTPEEYAKFAGEQTPQKSGS
jgi:Protein of unknown function (DUF1573)